MAEHIRFRTKSNGVTELTGQIKEIVENSGVRDGICVVYTTHTTGAVTLTSFGIRWVMKTYRMKSGG